MLQGVWNINFFCQSLKITSDILRYIRYSALKCHLAAAFCFIINVAWFIFIDLSSDAWTFSCLYCKRYIIYGQNSHSQEFQQNNLLKSCIGSLVKSENCNRKASPPDLAHCAPPSPPNLDNLYHFFWTPMCQKIWAGVSPSLPIPKLTQYIEFVKSGRKNWAGPSPPSFGQNSKEQLFFSGDRP